MLGVDEEKMVLDYSENHNIYIKKIEA